MTGKARIKRLAILLVAAFAVQFLIAYQAAGKLMTPSGEWSEVGGQLVAIVCFVLTGVSGIGLLLSPSKDIPMVRRAGQALMILGAMSMLALYFTMVSALATGGWKQMALAVTVLSLLSTTLGIVLVMQGSIFVFGLLMRRIDDTEAVPAIVTLRLPAAVLVVTGAQSLYVGLAAWSGVEAPSSFALVCNGGMVLGGLMLLGSASWQVIGARTLTGLFIVDSCVVISQMLQWLTLGGDTALLLLVSSSSGFAFAYLCWWLADEVKARLVLQTAEAFTQS